MRAFELAGVPVPEALRIMWDRYKARAAAVSFLCIMAC